MMGVWEEAHKVAGIKVCHMDVICATCTYMNLWSLGFATLPWPRFVPSLGSVW
jgi:hypothetical protein